LKVERGELDQRIQLFLSLIATARLARDALVRLCQAIHAREVSHIGNGIA
jgi:hypothetical protein